MIASISSSWLKDIPRRTAYLCALEPSASGSFERLFSSKGSEVKYSYSSSFLILSYATLLFDEVDN